VINENTKNKALAREKILPKIELKKNFVIKRKEINRNKKFIDK